MNDGPLIEFWGGDEGMGVRSAPALDIWRANYQAGTASLADHQRMYERIVEEFPEQNYYEFDLAVHFFRMARPLTVFELGGWDGALAKDILPSTWPEITSWTNSEIVKVPQACDDPRYHFVVPDVFAWARPIVADAFVASHVLEHLTTPDLQALIAALDCEWAYVDVPLGREGQDWVGTTTTHVLPLSISEFDQMWHDAGWTIERKARRTSHVPSFVRFLRRY